MLGELAKFMIRDGGAECVVVGPDFGRHSGAYQREKPAVIRTPLEDEPPLGQMRDWR
jgi:hypothetical protein